MSSHFQKIKPVKPASSYLGGKRLLSKRIIERINHIDHKNYVEPFVGMGGVFLRRTVKAKVEIINDYSQDVANFYRIMQRHYLAFMDMLKWQITSRANFEKLKAQNPSSLTDLERAARFLYLQRLAYGGKVRNRNYGTSAENPGRFNITKLVPILEDLNERLAGVVIENLPWQDFIKRYDKPATLFYLDPPYYGNENDYGLNMFARDEFYEMADILSNIKGKFLLSMSNHPEVHNIFKNFAIDEVDTTYSVYNLSNKQVTELIISNI